MGRCVTYLQPTRGATPVEGCRERKEERKEEDRKGGSIRVRGAVRGSQWPWALDCTLVMARAAISRAGTAREAALYADERAI